MSTPGDPPPLAAPPRRLGPAERRVMPWKNGLGTTSEIHCARDADGAVLWRVSIAEVAADGPFSSFPGYDRQIATIAGPGMVLAHRDVGRTVALGPLAVHAFAGEWDTRCALRGGAIQDMNLMLRRGRASGELTFVTLAAGAVRPLDAGVAMLCALAGSAAVAGDGWSAPLAAGESLLAPWAAAGGVSPPGGWALRGTGGAEGPAALLAVVRLAFLPR